MSDTARQEAAHVASVGPPNMMAGSSGASVFEWVKRIVRRNINVAAVIVLFVVLFVAFSIAAPYFLTTSNIVNMARQMAASLIAGIGMTMVLAVAGIDLSIGSVLTLASAALVPLMDHGLGGTGAVIAVLIIGAAVGALNGYFSAYQQLPAFIVTLAGLVAFTGVANLVAQGESYQVTRPGWLIDLGQGSAGPIPYQVFVEIAAIWAGWYTLNRLRFGKHMLGIGSNEEAVRRSGVNTRQVVLCVYLISGFCAAAAGLLETARVGSGSAELVQNFELLVIAGVVLGGTSLFGGRATITGTVFGVCTLEIIENGLILIHVNSYWVPIVEGAIVLGAVLLNSRIFGRLKLGTLASR